MQIKWKSRNKFKEKNRSKKMNKIKSKTQNSQEMVKIVNKVQ